MELNLEWIGVIADFGDVVRKGLDLACDALLIISRIRT